MFTARTRSFIGACAVLCGLAIPAAAANAASLYVSNSAPVTAGGKSCTQPNYNTIQGAIDALKSLPSGTINVCPGTYTEQLTIVKPLKLTVAGTAGSAKVKLPASPAVSKTKCDETPNNGNQPNEDGISICTPGTVSITGLKVEAKWPEGTCYDSLYGILVAGGATLKATNVTIDGAGAFPIDGCQGGVGIEVGMHWTTPVEVGHANLKGVTVTNYQKNGITIEGKGSTATIGTTTVKGAGATSAIAQNGIQVSGEGQAKIKSSNISGNECEVEGACGPEGFSQTQSTGLLFFGAAPGSSVTSSTIGENDIGAYYVSAAGKQPASSELLLSKDAFAGNRDEGVALDQGDATLKGGTITGPGEVGIEIYQYEGQELSSQSSGASTRIEGMSEAGVRVSSDKAAGDKPGSFTLTKSTFAGDKTVLLNESGNFVVVF